MASHSGRLSVRLVSYAGQLVAMGTMGYKHESMVGNGERTTAMLAKT
jgi:acetoacetate decarboxylase